MTIEERDETEQEDEVVVAEETILRQLQDEEDNHNKLQQYRKEQEEAIGEDWQEYLRKQIRQEMQQRQQTQQELRPNQRRSAVPSVIAATSSFPSHHSEETSFEEETWYSIDDRSALRGVQVMASNLMGLLEEGISDFFLGPPDQEQKKPKKKSKTKEEPKVTNRCVESPKMLLGHKFRW